MTTKAVYNPKIDFRNQLVRQEDGFLFHALLIGDKYISIQANRAGYCEPAMDGLGPFDYTSFEVLWPGDDQPEGWVQPSVIEMRLMNMYFANQKSHKLLP